MGNAANNNTFFKEVELDCIEKKIDFHYQKNHVRYLAHVINLTSQEILKFIKAGEAQDEHTILEETSDDIIPKLRKLIVKIRSSPQRRT